MESAGGVADDYVGVSCLARLNCVVYNSRRVCALAVLDYLDSRAVSPLFKLLDCSGSESVRRGEDNFFALVFVHCGELAYGSGLAHAVDADDENDGGESDKAHFLAALKHLGDYLFYLVLDGFRLAQMLFHNALAQLLDYLRRGHAADIAHDEYLFELVIKFVVNFSLAVEHRVDGSRHILAGFFESLVYS